MKTAPPVGRIDYETIFDEDEPDDDPLEGGGPQVYPVYRQGFNVRVFGYAPRFAVAAFYACCIALCLMLVFACFWMASSVQPNPASQPQSVVQPTQTAVPLQVGVVPIQAMPSKTPTIVEPTTPVFPPTLGAPDNAVQVLPKATETQTTVSTSASSSEDGIIKLMIWQGVSYTFTATTRDAFQSADGRSVIVSEVMIYTSGLFSSKTYTYSAHVGTADKLDGTLKLPEGGTLVSHNVYYTYVDVSPVEAVSIVDRLCTVYAKAAGDKSDCPESKSSQ